MSTKWVVTTATERVSLDENRGGEVTFTVTNQSSRTARAVFDIRTGDGVDDSWFTIDDPQRPIRPAASVPYLVKIQVGQDVPPGSYEIAGRVCPPDTAPEESFVLSRRVLVEVPPPPAPQKKKFPWWIVAAAALLVLVIGVVTWLVWPSGEPEPQPEPSPTPVISASPEPVAYVDVPNTRGKSLVEAKAALEKAKLTLGSVQYFFGGSGIGQVQHQSVPPATLAPEATEVDVIVYAPVAVPLISSPANNSSIKPNAMPTVIWTQPNPWVGRWLVTVKLEHCLKAAPVDQCRLEDVGRPRLVSERNHQPQRPPMNFVYDKDGWRYSGWIEVHIQPVDDLGTAGRAGIVRVYLEH